MADILETLMIAAFGISWPINAYKSYKARTTKGKSLAFLILIFTGYIFGIIAKLINKTYMANFSQKWYVLVVYCFNFVMVGTDLCLYFRNKRIDKEENNK